MTNTQRQLIEFSIQDLVRILVEDRKISIIDGMKIVYESQLFKLLQDVKTGLYQESPLFLYDMLKDELEYGRIIQREI